MDKYKFDKDDDQKTIHWILLAIANEQANLVKEVKKVHEAIINVSGMLQ